MNLEIKHLAPYLQYNIKVKFSNFDTIYNLLSIGVKNDFEIISENKNYFNNVGIEGLKPILIPIKDLDKLIYEEFSKLDDFKISEYTSEIIELFCFENTGFEEELELVNLQKLPYECIDFMFKNHYDVFGLIEKGLAISIHDIKK